MEKQFLLVVIFNILVISNGDRGLICARPLLNGTLVPFYCITGQYCCDNGYGPQCCNPAVDQSLITGRIVAASIVISLVIIGGFVLSFLLRNKMVWRGDPVLNSRYWCCVKKPTRFYARTLPILHSQMFPDKHNFVDVEDPFFGDRMKDQLVPELATIDMKTTNQYGIVTADSY